MSKNKIVKSTEDRMFSILVWTILSLTLFIVIYPLWFVVIASFSDPLAVFGGKVWLYPVGFSYDAYKLVWKNQDIWMGYQNTILYTIIGTAINIAMTMTAAYALSRKKMFGRKYIMFFILFTMFFSGGLVPTYLLVKQLGLYNTFVIMVILNAVVVYNLVVARTYLENTISEELFESAYIDGCTDIKIFFKIVLPLSTPIIAVLILFYAVSHWNQYFNALIYLQDRSKAPLQIILREILLANMSSDMTMAASETDLSKFFISESLKFAVIIVSSVPMIVLYPFLQKFFVKGIMVGALKG